jgi:prophage regulatory protein
MRILRKPALKAKIGLSSATTDRLEKSGQFPRRVLLSRNATGWIEEEIDQWISDRAAEQNR